MPWTKLAPEVEELSRKGAPENCDRQIGYAEAIREAFVHAMELDPNVFVMGQGVDDAGGTFGATRGLHEQFGANRSFDTPLAEAGMAGIAVGAALGGMRPVQMHNRPDFFYLILDELVNHASKWHYMFGGQNTIPLVIWACIGRGWGSGAQHSQALQGTMMQFPGLKFVMPSTAYDAKGLMLSAIKDNNPVVIMEHRHNFRFKGAVPEELYTIPIGKGAIRREGKDVSIVTISNMVNESLAAAETLAKEGIDVEIVDLRSLRPLDEGIILETLKKTGKLVVADSGWKTGGVTAEVAAIAAEKGYDLLKAPVKRVACPDVPTPSGYTLEDAFYIGPDDVIEAVRELHNCEG
jgi:pyruvate dehydrogenase E1 component beta subunit